MSASVVLTLGYLFAQHYVHNHQPPKSNTSQASDTRLLVAFPPELAAHTLANMRDHIVALAEIHEQLAQGHLDLAARIAEQRLGMSSLQSHGAHAVSRYMPQGMREAGSAMHRAASRFAIEAENAAITADINPALGLLGEVINACAGCHASYRLR